MKKILIISFLLIVVLQWTPAQRSAAYTSEDRLFRDALEMFYDANYTGCSHQLVEYKKNATDPDLMAEADWLLIVCDYKQGKANTESQFKEYLENYPDTKHKNQAYFYIGSSHFEKNDFAKTIYWLEKVEPGNLPQTEQEDCIYRMAYSCMKSNKTEESYRLFGLLQNNSKKYKDAATYYRGYLDYTEKKYDKALTSFSSLKNHPEYRKSVLYYLTQIHYIQKNYPQTIIEGEALLTNFQYETNNAEIHRIVGNAYYEEGNREKAMEHLLKYVSSTQNPARNDLYVLGLLYFEAKNYPEAIKFLSNSIQINDEIGQNAYLYLGQAYLKTGDKKNAIMAFEAATRTDFDKRVKEAATYNYAMLLHETSVSPFGESVSILENFLNEFPQSIYTDRVNDCLVDVYLTTKNYDAALASINHISKPGTKILEAKQKIYFHQGILAYVNNQFEDAIKHFTNTIQAGNYALTEKANALYWRSDAYYRLGNYTSAINGFKSFLQPGSGGDVHLLKLSNYNVGYCFFDQKEYNAAGAWFENYIALEKDSKQTSLADAYNRRGDCYFYKRQFKEAENAYLQAAKLQPSEGDYSLFQSAFILGLQKDYKGKIILLDKLIAKYPDSYLLPDALYEKGRAFVMLNNAPEAIETYRDVLNKYPNSSYARKAGTQIGLLYFNQNKLPQSTEAYKKVIADYPGSEEARVALQDLKSVYLEMNNINGYAQFVNSLGGAKFEVSEQDSLTYFAAEKLFLKGEDTKALSAMRTYLQSFPKGIFSTKAHFYSGCLYYDQKDFTNARKEFIQVLNAGDTEFTEGSLLRMAYMDYSQQNYKTALPFYERLSSSAEKKENKTTALLGIIRCAYPLNKNADVIKAADNLLKESNLSPEQSTEAKYFRSKAFLAVKEGNKAIADLKDLGKDTRTAWGAEAKYLLAQYYFDTKQTDRAETEINDFIKSGTSHSYWLARSFILLSDIYASKGDNFQAKQYLESLMYNYKGNDNIKEMIEERMLKLK